MLAALFYRADLPAKKLMGDGGLELNSQKPPQLLENKKVKDTHYPTPVSETVHDPVHHSVFCPELQAVISIWQELPEHIKAAVNALVQTQIKEKK